MLQQAHTHTHIYIYRMADMVYIKMYKFDDSYVSHVFERIRFSWEKEVRNDSFILLSTATTMLDDG